MRDKQTLQEVAAKELLHRQTKILEATQNGDIDELARHWTDTAEQTLHKSVVDCEGHNIVPKQACLGRSRGKLLHKQPVKSH